MNIIDTKLLPSGEEVRVAFQDYRGKTLLHVRRWYLKDGEREPGKGVAINAADLPWLRRAILEAEQVALRQGLLDEESYESIGETMPAEMVGSG